MLFGIVPLEAISFVVLGQRRLRHADRRLGLALRADHRLVRVHLAVGVDEHAVGALAAAARRGVRHGGDFLPGRRGRGLVRSTGMALLETHSLTKSFGALTAVNGVSLARRSRHAAFDHRPERRRQDHALQPAHRHLRAELGPASFSTARTSPARRRTASPTSAWRARSSAPTCFPPSRSSTTSGSPPSPAALRGGPAWQSAAITIRSDRASAASPRGCGAGGQGEPPGARNLARRAAPARARHRARRGAARAAARRAGRRTLAG